MTLAMVIGIQSGCTPGREFRAAAGPAIQNGISLILDGLVDGIFAAIEPEPDGQSDSSPGS